MQLGFKNRLHYKSLLNAVYLKYTKLFSTIKPTGGRDLASTHFRN